MLTPSGSKIVEGVLKMTAEQFERFSKNLSPEYREYLDVLLEKYQRDLE